MVTTRRQSSGSGKSAWADVKAKAQKGSVTSKQADNEQPAGGKKSAGTKSNSTQEGAPSPKRQKTSDDQPKDGRHVKEEDVKAKNGKDIKHVVDWLLSDEAWDMSHPELTQGFGEIDWSDEQRRKTPPPESAAKNPSGDAATEPLEYPGTHLTPMQLLICSLLLSKPLSHRLGLRTIKTLFNDPFNLRTAKDLDLAGYETRRKAMWEARTQHKEKTAAQLGDLCEGVRKLCGGQLEGDKVEQLAAVRKEAGGDNAKLQEILGGNIKGVGPTGVGIFLRGVQVQWDEFYPYADERCLKDAARFGLIPQDKLDAGKLADAVRGSAHGSRSDKLERERFVKLLEVLIGLDLEKKLDAALEAVGAASA